MNEINNTKLLVLYDDIIEFINSSNLDFNKNFEDEYTQVLLDKVRQLFPSLTKTELRSLLFVLNKIKDYHQEKENRVEVVGTFPDYLDTNLRQTVSVVRQLILEAEKSILITGYSISEFAKEIIELLIMKSKQGVKVQFFIDKSINIYNLLSDNEISNPNLEIYKYKKNDSYSSLHAKVIVSDNYKAFLSSSNLSYNGIVNNIELGPVVSGKNTKIIVNFFDNLILNNLFTRI